MTGETKVSLEKNRQTDRHQINWCLTLKRLTVQTTGRPFVERNTDGLLPSMPRNQSIVISSNSRSQPAVR